MGRVRNGLPVRFIPEVRRLLTMGRLRAGAAGSAYRTDPAALGACRTLPDLRTRVRTRRCSQRNYSDPWLRGLLAGLSSGGASGWGSPVRCAAAVATSLLVAVV